MVLRCHVSSVLEHSIEFHLMPNLPGVGEIFHFCVSLIRAISSAFSSEELSNWFIECSLLGQPLDIWLTWNCFSPYCHLKVFNVVELVSLCGFPKDGKSLKPK